MLRNSAPARSPSCARAGRWGRSESRPTSVITYLILLAALRFVGVSESELPAADAFAAFAIAFWAGAVLSHHRQRPRRRRRRPHRRAHRAEQRLRRRARRRGAPMALLLLGHPTPARRDHAEPIPQGEPPRATTRRRGHLAPRADRDRGHRDAGVVARRRCSTPPALCMAANGPEARRLPTSGWESEQLKAEGMMSRHQGKTLTPHSSTAGTTSIQKKHSGTRG